jgi:AraC family transcriptional regulator, positive regulator of tynA and feaB
MELHEWSTDAIRPGLRLEYWVGALCQAFLEMDCDPRARSGFEGRITQVNIGELGFHRVISEAQDELGISVRTLHRAFSAQGRSFGGTLRKLRLEEAQRLLEAPFLARLSVSEVGRRCGFADASHFVREFHQATGMTPGHLRKIRGVDGNPIP